VHRIDSAYHNRFKQQAAKNLLNDPVSRACLDRVDANVSVRMLSSNTVQHLDLELLMLLPKSIIRAPRVDEDAVDVVLGKAPPRVVKTERFAPVLASWCCRGRTGPEFGRGNGEALRLLPASTRTSEVTTRQKRTVMANINRFVPRIDNRRTLIFFERKRFTLSNNLSLLHTTVSSNTRC
jgi:hypothetical protein